MSEDVPPYGDPRAPAASLVIGAEDMKRLSGYKQRASVAKWCTKNKIKFFRDANGWPVTTADALNRALFGSEPDFGAHLNDVFDQMERANPTHWRNKRKAAARARALEVRT